MSTFLSACAAAACYSPIYPRILSIPTKTLTALDVGCGNGLSTKELANRFPDYLIHGIDRNPAVIQKARKNFPGAIFYRKDLFEMPTKSHFDIIQMKNMLHDIHDIDRTINRIRLHLRPNGVFILSEQHFNDMIALSMICRSCSSAVGPCREFNINDNKAELIFHKLS